jgi:hypothetical protein
VTVESTVGQDVEGILTRPWVECQLRNGASANPALRQSLTNSKQGSFLLDWLDRSLIVSKAVVVLMTFL